MTADSDPATRWPQVRELFERALALPAERRAAFVASAGAPAPVCDEVLSLLAHAEAAELEGTGLAQARPVETIVDGRAGDGALEGQRLGPWRITGPLGHGGMGEVMRAHRCDGAYEGQAAVKILKRGMDSAALLARFAQEQRVLARMNHPHIARLFDAGLTPDARPYFVMELVDGQPIDRAVQGLPIEARLALFLQLTEAVAYAHRQLLVHRDLKPSNVLVDAQGQVKLLDFGIAKALEAGEDDTATTQQGQRPFTPHYASPEQVRGEPVGTGTDIYSLGVLLYRLLTGLRPYGRDATTPQAAARSVLEDAPTRPSSLSPGLIADPQWLATRKRLVGDLDNILLKALEKPLERRYATVEALAADIRAHLAGYPVSARPGSLSYLLRKFVARHRASVGVGALGLAGVVAALVAALWQAQRAELARAQSERRFVEVRQLAKGLVFKYHDQIASLPGSTATREALLADAVRYLDGLRAEGAAMLDPALAREVAESYFRIAVLQGEQFSPGQERLAEAEVHLDRALALLPRYVSLPALPVEALHTAADMWSARASQASRAARLATSLEALGAARVLVERAAASNPAEPQVLSRLASVEGRVGLVLGGSPIGANLGRVEAAIGHLRRSAKMMQALEERAPGSAEWAHQHAWACQNLATALLLSARYAEAVSWAERTVMLRDAAADREPANAHYRHQRAIGRILLSQALSYAGAHERALRSHEDAVAIARSSALADAANMTAARDLVLADLAGARVQALAGQAPAARRALERVLVQWPAAAAGDESPSGADFYMLRVRSETLLWLARVLPPSEAERAYALATQARALMAPQGAQENAARAWAHAMAIGEQAAALSAQGRHEAARASAREALAAWQGAPGDGVPGMLERWVARDRRLAGL